MIYSKIFRAARANLLRVVKNFWRKTHEKPMIYLKIFPRCARQFVKNFIKVIHDFLKKFTFMKLKEDESHITKIEGAMLIVILLTENWSHITKISNITEGQY